MMQAYNNAYNRGWDLWPEYILLLKSNYKGIVIINNVAMCDKCLGWTSQITRLENV